MRTLIKNFFNLSAPPTALPENTDVMLIGQARERVSAVWEGAELINFLDDTGYHLVIRELPKNIMASCNPVDRIISFNSMTADADNIASTISHEAFHGLQFDQVPAFLNFDVCLLRHGDKPALYFDKKNPVDIMHPDDLIYANNLLEMGAFAMQSHIVNKMAREAGDDAARYAAIRFCNFSVSYYQRIYQMRDFSGLNLGDIEIISAPKQYVMAKYGREAVATAVTAYNWFWNDISDKKVPSRYAYSASKSDFLLARIFNEESPYFAMKRAGYEFDFQPLSKEQIRLLGTGCGQNMFSLPDFADVTSAAYRQEMSAQCRENIAKANTKLGLKLV